MDWLLLQEQHDCWTTGLVMEKPDLRHPDIMSGGPDHPEARGLCDGEVAKEAVGLVVGRDVLDLYHVLHLLRYCGKAHFFVAFRLAGMDARRAAKIVA